MRCEIRTETAASRSPLVIGCGALARELVELTRRAGLPAMDLTCLPASLHNRPDRIPGAVAARIRRARAQGYEQIFVAYADCGTGGLLDRILEQEGIARLEGAHCYEVYAGRAAFAALHDAEPGTFYLTDYLVRNFDRLVVRGLGLDRHPELLPLYFGNYRRLVYLAQTDDSELLATARAAANRLGGLAFERRLVGLGELAPALASFVTSPRLSYSSQERITGGQPFDERRATVSISLGNGIPLGTLDSRLNRTETPEFFSDRNGPSPASKRAGSTRRRAQVAA